MRFPLSHDKLIRFHMRQCHRHRFQLFYAPHRLDHKTRYFHIVKQIEQPNSLPKQICAINFNPIRSFVPKCNHDLIINGPPIYNIRNLKFTTNSYANDPQVKKAKQILDYLKDRNSQFNASKNEVSHSADEDYRLNDCSVKEENLTAFSNDQKLNHLSMGDVDSILYDLSKIKHNDPITKGKSNNSKKESFDIIPPAHVGTEAAILATNILQEVEYLALFIQESSPSFQRNHRQHRFSQKNNKDQSILFQPKVNNYNSVIECWAKSGGGKTAALNAERLLYKMLHQNNIRPKTSNPCQNHRIWFLKPPKPNLISFTLVLEAWAKSEANEAGQRAETIFSKLMRNNTQMDAIGPDVYVNVMYAWANSHGAKNAAERATLILEEIILRAEQSKDPNRMPDTFAFNAVLKAWSNNENKKLAAKTSLALLDKMEKNMIQFGESSSTMPFYKRTKMNKSNSSSSYNTVKNFVTPTTASYNYVLDCLVKSGHENSTQKVEEILRRMIELCNDGYYDKVKPNCYSFNIVITALARSNHHKAATRADAILTILLDLYKNGDEDLKPDTACFNACIYAWSRSREKGSAMKAESVLNNLEEWGQKYDSSVRPNTISYSSAITAWARSNEKNAGHRAERLLAKMEKAFEEGNLEVKPNIITYSAVMDALAKSGTRFAGSKVESLMSRIEGLGLKPNLITFNIAISAISQSGEKNITKRVDIMLKRMKSYKLKPDTQTWNNLIMSCIHEKGDLSIKKGESMLIQMEALHKNGDQNVKPNATTYTNLMKLYARSDLPDKAIHTEKLFLTMKHRYEDGEKDMRPTISSYTTLLQACAYTIGNKAAKKEALMIALKTFQSLDDCHYLQPVQVIYGILIEVFEKLIDDRNERDQYLSKFFKRCCNEGHLDNYVLRALHRSAQSNLWEELTSMKLNTRHYDINVKNLPSQWSSAHYKVKRR